MEQYLLPRTGNFLGSSEVGHRGSEQGSRDVPLGHADHCELMAAETLQAQEKRLPVP